MATGGAVDSDGGGIAGSRKQDGKGSSIMQGLIIRSDVVKVRNMAMYNGEHST
jgi:hypothetical protein